LDFADQRPRSFTNSTFLCFISDSPLGVRIPQERVQGNRGAEERSLAFRLGIANPSTMEGER